MESDGNGHGNSRWELVEGISLGVGLLVSIRCLACDGN